MKPRRILVVDDEPGIRQSLSGALEDDGYSVEAVENGEACLEALGRAEFELVLLDIWLPAWTAWRSCHESRRFLSPNGRWW